MFLLWLISITSLVDSIACNFGIHSILFNDLRSLTAHYWIHIDCILMIVCPKKHLPCTWSIYGILILLRRLSVAFSLKFFIPQHAPLCTVLLIFGAEIWLWELRKMMGLEHHLVLLNSLPSTFLNIGFPHTISDCRGVRIRGLIQRRQIARIVSKIWGVAVVIR
jgi:hypothetical protein